MSKLLLIINAGSSSIKVTVFDNEDLTPLFKGTFNASNSLEEIFNLLTSQYPFSFQDVIAIGHRFVHGGEKYTKSIMLNDKILKDLEELKKLAPLHNEPSLKAIKACLKLNIPQVIVFDTAFHQQKPEVATYYALPFHLSEKYHIKRYGFHGISHAFLWEKYLEETGKKESKVITLHLGNGCSLCAINKGISVDTTMGFTPAEGLIMGTRSGDIDPAIIEFLCEKEKMTPKEVLDIVIYQSGLKGVSELSSDMSTLIENYSKDKKAKLAIDLFCYRIIKYLGSYMAILEGVDALIFSGGIGENGAFVRTLIIEKMKWLNWELDHQKNNFTHNLEAGKVEKISSSNSSVPIYVIASNENFYIAKEVKDNVDTK